MQCQSCPTLTKTWSESEDDRGSYYLSILTMGFEEISLCDRNGIETKAVSSEGLCMDYFCSCSIGGGAACTNLTQSMLNNSTFREEYFLIVNYCMNCNGEEAFRFRTELDNPQGKCVNRFPTYTDLQSAFLGHCNQELSDNIQNVNLGIIDKRFFDSTDGYYSNKWKRNVTTPDRDNILHLFHSTFQRKTENPLFCWSKNSQPIDFQCDDAYTNFLKPLKYFVTPVLFMGVIMVLVVVQTAIVTIPSCLNKVRHIKKLPLWSCQPRR